MTPRRNLFLGMLFVILFFISCDRQENAFGSTSPNGEITIIVKASKGVVFDPWKVDVRLGVDTLITPAASFEIYADEVSEETVQFTWRDNTYCEVTFPENDGDRVFALQVGAAGMMFSEISQ